MAKINWDTATESKLAAAYKVARETKSNEVAVAELAETFGKTKRQIQGKLVHMKVYVVDEKAPASPKDEGPTKKDYVAELRALNVPFDADGLIPVKKETLAGVVAYVKANTPAAVAA
jgi:hypothetical protein